MFDVGLSQLSETDLIQELHRRFPLMVFAGVNTDDEFHVWRFGHNLAVRGAAERMLDIIREQDT